MWLYCLRRAVCKPKRAAVCQVGSCLADCGTPTVTSAKGKEPTAQVHQVQSIPSFLKPISGFQLMGQAERNSRTGIALLTLALPTNASRQTSQQRNPFSVTGSLLRTRDSLHTSPSPTTTVSEHEKQKNDRCFDPPSHPITGGNLRVARFGNTVASCRHARVRHSCWCFPYHRQ